MIILSHIMRNMVLSMKDYPNLPMQVRHGMTWSGSLKNEKYSRGKVSFVAFPRFLRYNVMDCQQGGKAFEREIKRRRKIKL